MHDVEFCKIKQGLIQFNVLCSLSGTLYDSKVGQSSIIEHNLIALLEQLLRCQLCNRLARGFESHMGRLLNPPPRDHLQSHFPCVGLRAL